MDDLLLIWEGSVDTALPFVDNLNINSFGLNFTHTFDGKITNFLDLTLSGCEENGIMVRQCRKSTAVNLTLRADSCHPQHVIKNVPVGELIRYKRNCSTPLEYKKVEEETMQRLRAQKYPDWALNRAKEIVDKKERQC